METIKLDLIPGKKMPSLHASQYDDGREHGIDLFENGIVYKLDGTETLTINERKGDDCICSLDIENDFADTNHIVFASTEQMCAVWGNNICELVIAKGEKIIGTLNFILEIEPSPTENGIESESEIKNLKRQIEEITEEVIGDDYYTAEQTDEAIENATEGKADTTYVDTELNKKADKSTTYTKSQVDNALNSKMNKSNPTGTGNISVGNSLMNFGTNSQAFGSNHLVTGRNTFVAGEGNETYNDNAVVFGRYCMPAQYKLEIVGNGTNANNRSNARTLDENGNETIAGDLTFNGNKRLTNEIQRLDNRITDLPEAMVFKGTLGVGGTIETLPTASASNEGWMFKCITAGTYAGLTLKVGDTVTCFNPPNTSTYYWDKTGSQDTDTDTWRNIKVNGVEKLGNGISSGAVDFVGSANIDVTFDADGNKIEVATKNIYTQSEVDTLIANAVDSVLPTDTASGAVAAFVTSLAKPLINIEVDNSATKIYQFGFNLFDKTTTINDAYISDTDGSQKAATGSKCTDYIPIVGDTEFYVRSDQTQGAWGAFYDENKTFISAWTGYTPNGSYKAKTSPANARFARFTIVRNNSGDENTFCFSVSGSDNGQYKAYNPNSNVYLVANKDDIVTFEGYNTIFADNGNVDVFFKCSVVDYVNAHASNGNRSLGVNLSKGGGGSEEESTEESEDTEKVKLDETKVEINAIGDDSNIKKLGGD